MESNGGRFAKNPLGLKWSAGRGAWGREPPLLWVLGVGVGCSGWGVGCSGCSGWGGVLGVGLGARGWVLGATPPPLRRGAPRGVRGG